MKLELAVVRIDGDTQARVGLDQDVVAEYALAMQDGDKFPVMVAFHDGSDYWLADGFHRFFARKANGELEAEFDVKQGTKRDALFYSFGANGTRGLKLSAEDIRAIITRMLQDDEWRIWSDVQIAHHVGCSSMTVGRVRHSLEDAGKVAPKKSTKYVAKDGKTKEMKTKKSSAKPKEEKKPEPEFQDQIAELTDTITQLHDENTILKDKIAIGQWDASEIEKIDVQETISDLRDQIKILEMENKSLRDSRDMFQNRNSELMRTVKMYQNKLKKAGIE
jgi:DNA-binding transcriptional regulator YhcF (GntR family)